LIAASLFDLAEAFICKPAELAVLEKEQRIGLIYARSNEIAELAGAKSFLHLAEAGVSQLSQAVSISREKFDELAAEGSLKSASCYAVVHLMAMNRLSGLKDSDQARTTAEVGELCYDMEHARLQGRTIQI
jgi:hypothetical protein